jgi:hypothetical protein
MWWLFADRRTDMHLKGHKTNGWAKAGAPWPRPREWSRRLRHAQSMMGGSRGMFGGHTEGRARPGARRAREFAAAYRAKGERVQRRRARLFYSVLLVAEAPAFVSHMSANLHLQNRKGCRCVQTLQRENRVHGRRRMLQRYVPVQCSRMTLQAQNAPGR